MHAARPLLVPALASLLVATTPRAPTALRWGAGGHEMAARAALAALPSDMPRFFVAAGDQLVYLDPEPDRWRSQDRREMRNAWAPDHYVNLEDVPAAALEADDRYAYMAALYATGVPRPEQTGFLPFAIVERYQRLVTEWALWRRETDPVRRSWIEARIVNDAGILGHFVTDGAQPHHTTIHYNGWAADAPNPDGFTRDRTFHGRFETDFVDRHVELADVLRHARPARSVAGDARGAVMEYLRATHAQVDALYRLDRDVGFDPAGAPRPETRDFAARRLAAGAEMLATLWRSAWEESR